MNLERVVEEAYQLYMPQDKYEITELSSFVEEHRSGSISPYNIVEIGTKFGGTFYIWCCINRPNFENVEGVNISIDMSDGGIHGGIPDEEMNERDRWFRERFDNCYFIRGNSHDEQTLEVLADALGSTWSANRESLKTNEIDFLFIDGDHTYEGVLQDFEMYSPLVKRGGIIAFHDINDTQKHRDRNVYVGKLWDELKDDPRFTSIEFNSNLDWAGIGVLVVN